MGYGFVYFNVPNPVNLYAPNGFLGSAVLNADATQAVLSNPNYPQTPGIYCVFAILNPLAFRWQLPSIRRPL